jgi:pSer/pThr/pTyr-binding forkhead associated (FHA) protein
VGVKKATCKHSAGAAGKKGKRKNATLVITNGCFAGLEMTIEHKRTSLGKSLNCDICLDGPHVSDEHAVIHESEGAFVLEDMKSGSGTMLNGKEIQRNTLRSGDVIEIGKFRLKFSC